jgi:putative membrane protein
MKALLIVAGAAALLAGCTTMEPDYAAEPALAEDTMLPTSAPGYMEMAASSDMFEIESSRLALQRSRHPAVRSFAQMMIADHSRTSSEMMAAARQIGLAPPPPRMLPHHMDMLERLRVAPHGDFDRMYKHEQIMAHEEALGLHRNFADRGDAPPFRALAARAVPIIEAHFAHARSLPEHAEMMHPPHHHPLPPPPLPRRSGERG